MADDQFRASANWWDSSRNVVRFESRESQSGPWHGVGDDEMKLPIRSSTMENSMSSSSSAGASSGRSSVVFHERLQQQQNLDSPNLSNDPNLHMMMGLGLSSHSSMDWNQASFMRAEKTSEMLQQETGMGLSNRGFSLDQTQFSPQYSSCSGDSNITSQQLLSSNFQMDSSSSAPLYCNTSMLQGLLGPESNNQAHQGPISNFPYSTCLNSNNNNNQLHFTNNAPFWNASEPAPVSIKDARSIFFPSLHQPFSAPSFDQQSKNMVVLQNISEVRDSGGSMLKKSENEQSSKRPRNETPPSPLPAFKVRKEKMGDRITALQQLVSPFGKTDTASVLSEATEYIKFLHEQVTVLSTPYMKSGAQTQHHQNSGKSKEADGPKQDLRSRGLCLVPISSTFPVTHEPTVDFWTPTFGGTYR
ncbi:transcription factor bHLH123 isoform X2 [Arachis ipaensis]|uniref:transcription factor bHLH123 isoform X2 n=1 Tax=Arachis ipaensis TaxID=130454 RepID=UPI000A2B09F6|nr:transcription factor bHLH123 isoform X2 [Arachis ipaensis]